MFPSRSAQNRAMGRVSDLSRNGTESGGKGLCKSLDSPPCEGQSYKMQKRYMGIASALGSIAFALLILRLEWLGAPSPLLKDIVLNFFWLFLMAAIVYAFSAYCAGDSANETLPAYEVLRFFNNARPNSYETTAINLADAARLGQVRAWGRTIPKMGIPDHVTAVKQIPSDVWVYAVIDSSLIYGSFPQSKMKYRKKYIRPHTEDDRELYDAVRFNKKEIMELCVLEKKRAQKNTSPAYIEKPTTDSDSEILKLRGKIAALAESLGSYEPFSRIEDKSINLYSEIKESEHHVWARNPALQARREFLHHCGWAISRKKNYSTKEEDLETRSGLREAADHLELILSGEV